MSEADALLRGRHRLRSHPAVSVPRLVVEAEAEEEPEEAAPPKSSDLVTQGARSEAYPSRTLTPDELIRGARRGGVWTTIF
jgi:hypothetical protein